MSPPPERSDLSLRDTPALVILREHPELFAGMDHAALKAAQDLLRVAKRMLGAFGDEFARHGLSPGRYSVLMALYAEGSPMAPSEIAADVGVTRATMTGLIDGLMRDGLVSHAPGDESDRRRKAIGLSAKGCTLLGELMPEIFGRMCALVAPLSPDERVLMQRLLNKVETGLENSRPDDTETREQAT